ncbi:MAG TPA: hypothetical protein PK537_09350 [Candidatus Limiplasma sp.]|nr:hypothetical protein [Candidatus Limiplasma sp.]
MAETIGNIFQWIVDRGKELINIIGQLGSNWWWIILLILVANYFLAHHMCSKEYWWYSDDTLWAQITAQIFVEIAIVLIIF